MTIICRAYAISRIDIYEGGEEKICELDSNLQEIKYIVDLMVKEEIEKDLRSKKAFEMPLHQCSRWNIHKPIEIQHWFGYFITIDELDEAQIGELVKTSEAPPFANRMSYHAVAKEESSFRRHKLTWQEFEFIRVPSLGSDIWKRHS